MNALLVSYLCCQIEDKDRRFSDDQRVDLQIGKVLTSVYSVQAGYELSKTAEKGKKVKYSDDPNIGLFRLPKCELLRFICDLLIFD